MGGRHRGPRDCHESHKQRCAPPSEGRGHAFAPSHRRAGCRTVPQRSLLHLWRNANQTDLRVRALPPRVNGCARAPLSGAPSSVSPIDSGIAIRMPGRYAPSSCSNLTWRPTTQTERAHGSSETWDHSGTVPILVAQSPATLSASKRADRGPTYVPPSPNPLTSASWTSDERRAVRKASKTLPATAPPLTGRTTPPGRCT